MSIQSRDVFQTSFAEFVTLAVSTPLDAQLEPVIASRPLIASMMADEISFLVSVLASLKELSRTPKSKRPSAVQHSDVAEAVNVSKPNQISVVLVGCGGVGNVIASRLLSSKILHPTSLHIMTRQPQMLSKLSKSGCRCGVVHSPSVEAADVVIIATLPGQLPVVSQQLQGHIKTSAVVLSVCAGVSSDKLCTELRHPLCVSVAAEHTNIISQIASQIDLRLPNTRNQYTLSLIDCMFPFLTRQQTQSPVVVPGHHQSLLLTTVTPTQAKPAEGSIIQDTTLDDVNSVQPTKQLRSKVYRLVYVLAASATAGGLPFHEATFGVWGYLCSRQSQSRWTSTFNDHSCPSTSVPHHTKTTVSEAEKEFGTGDVFDPVRFSFATGIHFAKLVGVLERQLLQGFRERLQLYLTSLPVM